MSEPDLAYVRTMLVKIQMELTRTLTIIDGIQTASGYAEEMEEDLPDETEESE